MRTFISVDPPADAMQRILSIQNNFREKCREQLHGKFSALKWEGKEKFHITLLFIGETDEHICTGIHDMLRNKFNGIKLPPMNLTAERITAFPGLRYPRVIVLEMTEHDGRLSHLSEVIRNEAAKFGIADDKPFRPHITLARVRRDMKVNLTQTDTRIVPPLSFTANSISYYQSILNPGGSEYMLLGSFG